jgi:hypothetical protein
MKLRIEDLLASNLSLKNENQLLKNQVDNLKQNFRLEMREKDLEIRKIEDDYHWRKKTEIENSENLMKGVDQLQLENMDLKRDVDSLRVLVEEKDDHLTRVRLEQRKQERLLQDLTNGKMTRICSNEKR